MARRFVRLEHTTNATTATQRAIDPEYAALAAAVILQAVKDGKAGDTRARNFLCGGPLLNFWCALAGLDVNAAREYGVSTYGVAA